jgi:hypothetical protein
MSIQVREIHHYAVHVLAHPQYSQIIVLYNETGDMIGRLCFERSRTAPSVSHSGEVTNLHLPEAQYFSSIDVLRHESPVFLHSSELYAKIATMEEPVGEDEGISNISLPDKSHELTEDR